MKLSNALKSSVAKSLVMGLAMLLASSAFASSKPTFETRESLNLNGQKLPAGSYQLQWQGTGPNVEVSFLQGKKVVATTTAHMVDRDSPAPYDSAVVTHDKDGSASLSEIRFSGKKYVLSVAGSTDKNSLEESPTK